MHLGHYILYFFTTDNDSTSLQLNVRVNLSLCLTFGRRNFFFLILAHPVYKMWIVQEPNTLEIWNKLHFEEEKNGEYIPCLIIFLILAQPVYEMWIVQEPNT